MMSLSHVKEEVSFRKPGVDEQEVGGIQVRFRDRSDYRYQFGSISCQKPKAVLKEVVSQSRVFWG